MPVTHKPKVASLLTGSEYEAADAHREAVSTVADAGAAETLTYSTASVYDITLSEACTFTLAGATDDQMAPMTVILRGAFATNWPETVTWLNGPPPAVALQTVVLFSVDGGTAWLGARIGGSGGDFAEYTRDDTNYSTTSTSFTDIDATNLSLSLDTGTHRVAVSLTACANLSSAGLLFLDLLVDGTSVSGSKGIVCVEPAAGQNHNVGFTWYSDTMTADTHTFKLQWKVSTGTATLFAGNGGVNILQFAAREII